MGRRQFVLKDFLDISLIIVRFSTLALHSKLDLSGSICRDVENFLRLVIVYCCIEVFAVHPDPISHISYASGTHTFQGLPNQMDVTCPDLPTLMSVNQHRVGDCSTRATVSDESVCV